jgi:hypothetical protein
VLLERILPALQLTRMALVFTAISNSLCALLLVARRRSVHASEPLPYTEWFDPWLALSVAVMSVGLYGFGMSLNDIIDRRRDRQIAADRPLPSGRISLLTAHAICALLGLLALVAGAYFAWRTPHGTLTMLLLVWTGLLITFYDFAGKYLVAPGLLTLGLIRFFHAAVPAPQLPLLWHPLLLLNHVTILSTIAYHLEHKRPPLTRAHWWSVLGGLALANMMVIGLVWDRRGQPLAANALTQALWITPGLILPILAAGVFAIMGIFVYHFAPDPRSAGRTIMLYGLLWLIVYDVCFTAGYVGLLPAMLLLLLLPAAYFSVQLMRWWSRLLSLSQKPQYQRARD